MDMINLGREPISDDQPAGSDVSYSDDYQALVSEIKKLSSPTADSVIDWSNVTRLCTKILENESKNILVACFLSVALVRNKGVEGLAVGIHILRDMTEVYWDSLYPPKKRKKGRINALTWWNDNLKILLEGADSEAWQTDARNSLLDDLAFLDDCIAEQLPDGPMLRPLINLVSSKILEREEKKTEVVEEDVSPAVVEAEKNLSKPVVQASSPEQQRVNNPVQEPAVQAPSGESTDDIDAVAFLSTGRDFLLQASKKFFAQDQNNAASYQINRLIAWSEVDTAPPATNGETMLPPPDTQLVSRLESLYQSESWSDLLLSAEGNVRQYLFWIDLSFWVATALKQLGAKAASKSVALETRNYVKKIKGVEKLSFQGGLLFARRETIAWLNEEASSSTAVPMSQGQSSSIEDGFTSCIAEALKLVDDGGAEKAILFFQDKYRDTDSGKSDFFRDLGLCNIMLKAGNAGLALPFAERALAAVEKNRLEDWEPELAVTALTVIHNAYNAQSGEDWSNKIKEIVNRITLLAPEQSINMV